MKRSAVWTLVVTVLLALALAAPAGAQGKKAAKAAPAPSASEKTQLIDLNSASKDELKTLEGVGDATAQKIIDNRPYKNKTQLVSKKVVSQSVYSKISGKVIAKQDTGAGKKKGG